MSTRQEVYVAVDGERDYQEVLNPDTLSIGDEILLLEEYAERARYEWSIDFGEPETEALNMIRKIAGIAIRCMEHHGAQMR